ncbi:MAG: GatB/YqeY domain-containing protein [Acidobacteriia bacterium]|nr:GatB/YqeY domain-containing protein [Terriglobia bacterium]
MTFQDQLQKHIQEAMRSKNVLRLSTLRMMKAAIKNKEIEKIKALEEAECFQVLQTLIKQRQDSIEQFTRGGRRELAEKEAAEIKIIEEYLPAGASKEDIEKAVLEALAETGATSMKDLGAVMKAVMARFAGQRVDGKAVNELVRSKLSNPS